MWAIFNIDIVNEKLNAMQDMVDECQLWYGVVEWQVWIQT